MTLYFPYVFPEGEDEPVSDDEVSVTPTDRTPPVSVTTMQEGDVLDRVPDTEDTMFMDKGLWLEFHDACTCTCILTSFREW